VLQLTLDRKNRAYPTQKPQGNPVCHNSPLSSPRRQVFILDFIIPSKGPERLPRTFLEGVYINMLIPLETLLKFYKEKTLVIN